MYLEALSEKERKIFLDLAYFAMECDGEIAKEELETIETYKVECKLPEFTRTQRTMDECIKLLKTSEVMNRRIVFAELCGMWAADNKWTNEELKMMDRVSTGLGIRPELASRIKRWSREFREIVADGFRLIQQED